MAHYKRLSLQETAEKLQAQVNTLIILHRHPDGDAIGSGFALRLLLEAMGCDVRCSCDDELPERLAFLVPHANESIKYDALPSDFTPAQIIAVDTASPAQVGQQYALYEGRIDLMIDHHQRGEMYADGWIMGGCSSTGEMIYELSRELVRMNKLSKIPQGVDKLLYAAVSSDTGCFRYSNVSPDTHRIAAALLRSATTGEGFDPAEINHLLFEVKSEKLLLAEKLGLERLQRLADGRIGIVTFPIELKCRHGILDEHLETLVDIPRSLEGVEIAVAIRQPGQENVFRVSMRSCGDADVSAICASFGGGGHIKAAGCTITCHEGIDGVVSLIAQASVAALENLSK